MFLRILKITDIIIVAALIVLGIETLIKIKKSSNEQVEKIRKPLLVRINCIMCMTAASAVISILLIIFK